MRRYRTSAPTRCGSKDESGALGLETVVRVLVTVLARPALIIKAIAESDH